MPEWIFSGGAEEFRVKVNNGKNTFIKSKLTGFEWLPFKEELFRDREQRNRCHIMNIKIPKLTLEQLHTYIILEILYGKFTQAYKFTGWIDDEGKYTAHEILNKEKQIENGFNASSK